jgi:hypothetical protein
MKLQKHIRKQRKKKAYLIAENELLRKENNRMVAELVSIRKMAQVAAEQMYRIINAANNGLEPQIAHPEKSGWAVKGNGKG